MRLIAIANISDGKKVVGFRILDKDANKTKDVPVKDIWKVLSNNQLPIQNIRVRNNTLEGSNGSISRLPRIVNGELQGPSRIVITAKIGDVGYEVCDYTGEIQTLPYDKAISYAKEHRISNGKIEGNNIYPIKGEYTTYIVKEEDKLLDKHLITEQIKEYNLKCKTLGILPLQITIENNEVVVTSAKKDIRQAVIPTFATVIDEGAFDNCTQLTQISIPNGIKEIKQNAFNACAQLKSIDIPSSVDAIWDYAFSWCTGLEEVKFSDGLTILGIEAFSNCYSIKKIKLPNTLLSIDHGAFENCIFLEIINITDSIDSIETIVFQGCNSLKNIIMSEELRNRIVETFKSLDMRGPTGYNESRPFIGKGANEILDYY